VSKKKGETKNIKRGKLIARNSAYCCCSCYFAMADHWRIKPCSEAMLVFGIVAPETTKGALIASSVSERIG